MRDCNVAFAEANMKVFCKEYKLKPFKKKMHSNFVSFRIT